VVGRTVKERKLYDITKKGRRILEALKELRTL
jgi:predicted transcriptional regulator